MNALAKHTLKAEEINGIVERIMNYVRQAKGSVATRSIYAEFDDTDQLAVAKALRTAIERHSIQLNDDLTVKIR